MEYIRIDDSGGIREIRLDRPKVNAQSSGMLLELRDAFREAAVEPSIAGVLLTGEGRCFSAGLDLREMVAISDPEALDGFLQIFDEAYLAAFTLPKPLACALTGHGVAGGAVLPLMADHVVLADSDDLRFGLTELSVGVPFPQAAFDAVRLALPPRALRRLIYGADVVGFRDAYALGVGDSLSDDPVADARAWLAMTTSRPKRTFAIVKREMRAEAWNRAQVGVPPTVTRDELLEALTSEEVRRALEATLG